MGLATIDLRSHKVQTKGYKTPNLGVLLSNMAASMSLPPILSSACNNKGHLQ